MEEIRAAKYADIKDDHNKENDETLMSIYLQSIKDSGDSWPEHFFGDGDTDVFTTNPSEVWESENPYFVFVYPITEACGRTDGCDSGGWRIIGRDKLIKDEETGKILGFKKILKFCGETKARGYKRTWVMEEYRFPSKWHPKQDHVVCKIRLLFQTEISFLLAKHFSYSSDPLPATQSLPAYGVYLSNPQDDGAYHLQTIFDSGGNKWPRYVTNDVYGVHPSTLVDHKDQRFLESGLCVFANRTEACGHTDEGIGCWMIMEEDNAIYSMSHEVMGYRRVFKFCEEDGVRFFEIENGEEVLLTWIMEEYRLVEEAMKDKVLCVIKLCR